MKTLFTLLQKVRHFSSDTEHIDPIIGNAPKINPTPPIDPKKGLILPVAAAVLSSSFC